MNNIWNTIVNFCSENSLLLLFVALNIANVIVQTVKSLATINCGKTVAALVNAGAYWLYTIVTVYMLCELPLMWKAAIVAVCNLVGVFVVKWIEEKVRKDRLWKVEATVNAEYTDDLHDLLKQAGIDHTFVEGVGKRTIFNCYCPTQHESAIVRDILKEHNAKFFVSESKVL